MANKAYNSFLERLSKGQANLETMDLRGMLLDGSSTTPDNPDHDFVAHIVADELSDASYARITLTTKSVIKDDAGDRAELHYDNPVFPNLENGGVSAKFFVVYEHVTNDADSRLCFIHDHADIVPDGTDLTLTVGGEGAVHIRNA